MRLGLRARITSLLLVLSIVPPGAVVWFIRARVLGLLRAEDTGRIEDALLEFDAAIEREGSDNAQALAIAGSLLEGDPRYRWAGPPGRGVEPPKPSTSNLSEVARLLMQDVGLDCLTLLDASGVVLSSGLYPSQSGGLELARLDLPETSSSFLEENITPGVGRVLTLQSRRTLEIRGARLHLVGGRFLDPTFLRRLSPGRTVEAVLLDRDGAILAAGDPDHPLPVPPDAGQ